MELRRALGQLLQLGYSHRGAKTQPAQAAHYALRRSGIDGTPLGLDIRVSGQGQSLPVVPWLTFLDPDVTTKVTEGLYIVYLISADLERAFLTINQGATSHRKVHESLGLRGRAAERAAIQEISHETAALRAALAGTGIAAATDTIDLGSTLFLPTAYEVGAITCRSYELSNLPSNSALLADLDDVARLYPTVVTLKEQLVASNPQTFRTPARELRTRPPQMDVFFRPKDATDYVVEMPAHVQRKSRKHEALLENFVSDAEASGWTANSNVHPRDLELSRQDEIWLVEAKTVGANAEHAVREAIGQLYSYRHFHYRRAGEPDPHLLALFNEPVGGAFIELLADLGIEACWRETQIWRATPNVSRSLRLSASEV